MSHGFDNMSDVLMDVADTAWKAYVRAAGRFRGPRWASDYDSRDCHLQTAARVFAGAAP